MKLFWILVPFLGLQSLGAGSTYQINDGHPETVTGAGGGVGDNIYWSTSFTVVGGAESIDSIDIMFGADDHYGGTALDGTLVTLVVSRDSNHDGIADDGGMVSSLNTVVTGANTLAFQNYTIPTCTLAAGDGFVVAATILSNRANPCPADLDETVPIARRNYFAWSHSPLDPDHLSLVGHQGFMEGFNVPGNWMINAHGSPVPEPASAVVFLAGLALLRKRRASEPG